MTATATPLEHAIARETFTAALFDSHAEQSGLKPRWTTVREATRTHWRLSVDGAAAEAMRSQFSPLARERLPNAPDPFRVFAVAMAQRLGSASRSRARTTAGMRRAMHAAGGEAFGLWAAAIRDGLEAVQRNAGACVDTGQDALLRQLPDLRSAA